MDFIVNTHLRFLMEMKYAAQLDDRLISFLPTLIFLLGTFALIYRIFHRRTTRLTKTKIWLYRELGFHWTYFYLARIWFLVVKGFRHILAAIDEYAAAANIDENIVFNSTFLHGVLLLSLFSFSSIPLLIVIVKVWMKEHVPDFLLWVGQDPWLRSEIGLAGHYLDRPPTFPNPKRKEYAYRSKRSTSTEEYLPRGAILRNCKSMEEFRCIRAIEALVVED